MDPLRWRGYSDAGVPYESVGASHISQVLRSIVFGATSELCREIADASGNLNLQKYALADPAMAVACATGLRWEVLSWRIEEEEDGIASVQARLHDRAAAQMTQHEMEVIKQLAKFCSAEANTASEVKAGQVRAKLVAVGGSALAESPRFLLLFRFVLEQVGKWPGVSVGTFV